MPLSGPHTYLETCEEFHGHWTQVNAALSPGAMVINGYTLANFTGDMASLDAEMSNIPTVRGDIDILRQLRDDNEEPLRDRMLQIRGAINSQHKNLGIHGVNMELPSTKDDMGNWLAAMDRFKDGWTRVNAAGDDLVLFGTYELADFTTDCDTMEERLREIENKSSYVTETLRARDQLMDSITERLKVYPDAVLGHFPSNHSLTLSIPRLWPLPGRTPDPVTLTAVYNAGTGKFDLSWTASEDPDIDSYKVYGGLAGSPGEGDPINLLESLEPNTTSLSTTYGTTNGEGYGATFQVDVVLNTGNRRGSNKVTVFVPPGGVIIPPPG